MAVHVVDAHQRDPCGKGERLGGSYPDDHGADEARPVGDTDEVDVPEGQVAGLRQCLLQYLVDVLQVVPRSDLRHHAAKFRMYIDLRRDDVGQDLPPVRHHGDGRLVAAGFYA